MSIPPLKPPNQGSEYNSIKKQEPIVYSREVIRLQPEQEQTQSEETKGTREEIVNLTKILTELQDEVKTRGIDSRKIEALKQEVEALEKKFKLKSDRIEELESEIKVLRSEVASLKSRMEELMSSQDSMYRIISGQLSQQIHTNICRYVLPHISPEKLQHCKANEESMKSLIKRNVKSDERDNAWKQYNYITTVIGLTEDHLKIMEYIRGIRNSEAHPPVEGVELPSVQELEERGIFDAFFSAEDYESFKEMLRTSAEMLK